MGGCHSFYLGLSCSCSTGEVHSLLSSLALKKQEGENIYQGKKDRYIKECSWEDTILQPSSYRPKCPDSASLCYGQVDTGSLYHLQKWRRWLLVLFWNLLEIPGVGDHVLSQMSSQVCAAFYPLSKFFKHCPAWLIIRVTSAFKSFLSG